MPLLKRKSKASLKLEPISDPGVLQVFAAARKAGILPADAAALPRVSHVGFGLVLGEDGKRFRTRASEVSAAAVPPAHTLASSPRWRVLL